MNGHLFPILATDAAVLKAVSQFLDGPNRTWIKLHNGEHLKGPRSA
jgi:hypothetical protein